MTTAEAQTLRREILRINEEVGGFVLFADSNDPIPQDPPFALVTIKDGASEVIAFGLVRKAATVEIMLHTSRTGDKTLRDLADAWEAKLAALSLTDFHLFPPSREMKPGDFASYLVCTLTMNIATFADI